MSDLDFYLSLPWTVVSSWRSDAGEYVVVEIEELPGFVVTGDTPEEVDKEFWPGLRDFLESYLEEGKRPPVPEGAVRWLEQLTFSEEEPQARAKQPRSGSLSRTKIHRSGPGARKPRTTPAVVPA